MSSDRVTIIYNPSAGSRKNRFPLVSWFLGVSHRKLNKGLVDYVNDLTYELEKIGRLVVIKPTKHSGHARLIASAVEIGIIIGIGGDGTLNEIVNGLGANSKISLCPIPLGTANVLGVELNLGHSIPKIVASIKSGDKVLMDLGSVNDEYFLTMASIGLDAYITKQMTSTLKNKFGVFSYIFLALRTWPRYTFKRVFFQIDDDDTIHETYYLIVGNTKFYGGGLEMFERARIDDGYFDICMIKSKRLIDMIMFIVGLKVKSKKLPNFIEYKRCKSLTVLNDDSHVQIDGDYLGTSKSIMTLTEKAVSVITH